MEKHVLVQRMFTNWINMGLLQWAWVKKTVDGVKTHGLSGKEKVPDTAVSKGGAADSLLGQKDLWLLISLKKGETV